MSARLEDLKAGASVWGLAPGGLAKVVQIEWFGDQAVKVTFEDAAAQVRNREGPGANTGVGADGFGDGGGQGAVAAMIPVPSGVRVWLAVGHTDMRRGHEQLGEPGASRRRLSVNPPRSSADAYATTASAPKRAFAAGDSGASPCPVAAVQRCLP